MKTGEGVQRQAIIGEGTPVTRDINRVVAENGEIKVANPQHPR